MTERTALETKIVLDKFKLRSYQKPMVDALKKGVRKILAVWPRRAGKDLVSWTWMIRAALEKKGIYYYIFPTYSQSRKALFEGMTNDGTNFLSYIPKELVSAINSAEMKITLINGSLIRFVGSMDYNKLMGTNPSACVISEYGLSDPMALQYIRPILTANGGWLIVNSTPRGRNHLHTLAEIASKSDDWFYSKLTIDDTQHVSVEEIRKQIESGEVSESLAKQEYWTSFNEGAQGAFYNRELNRLLLEERICSVSYEPQFPVHCSFDIGLDTTAICFFQVIGTNVHFIDYYENSNLPLDHYIGIVKNKPYSIWGKYIFPHDMANREFTSGVSRIDTARNMGITVTLAPNLSIDDGIEATRCLLAKAWIDNRNCKRLIKCLENYMQEFNEKSQMYTGKAVHDQFSHGCFTADTLVLTQFGMRQIIDITNNDYVLTLDGWMQCEQAVKTKEVKSLSLVKFQDNTQVRCTPDHLFLTANGWKSAESLMKDTEILSSLMPIRSNLMEKYIHIIGVSDILPFVQEDYIEINGFTLLDLFHETVTFIIRTVIPIIIHYRILNASQRQNIQSYITNVIGQDLQLFADKEQMNGIHQMKVALGIENMLQNLKAGLNGKEKKEIVCFVVRNLKLLFEEVLQANDFVMLTAKTNIIEGVGLLKVKSESVYDITVPGTGHFSLANAAIVHNCDALRMAAVSIKRLYQSTSPEDLDKRYIEAMTPQASLPKFFRDDEPKY